MEYSRSGIPVPGVTGLNLSKRPSASFCSDLDVLNEVMQYVKAEKGF